MINIVSFEPDKKYSSFYAIITFTYVLKFLSDIFYEFLIKGVI